VTDGRRVKEAIKEGKAVPEEAEAVPAGMVVVIGRNFVEATNRLFVVAAEAEAFRAVAQAVVARVAGVPVVAHLVRLAEAEKLVILNSNNKLPTSMAVVKN